MKEALETALRNTLLIEREYGETEFTRGYKSALELALKLLLTSEL